MKTRDERTRELNELATSDQGREKIVALWKKYNHEDPGHWRPLEGWDYPAIIRGIVRHEYKGASV
jgi:hypothetical protein